MKRFPVEYRPDAVEDLEQVFLDVLEKSKDPVTAARYTDRLYAQCEKIGDVPYGGVAKDFLGVGLRMWPFEKSAVIFYIIKDDTVWITNVFGDGFDYEAFLKDRPIN